jgi:hypothetical protein
MKQEHDYSGWHEYEVVSINPTRIDYQYTKLSLPDTQKPLRSCDTIGKLQRLYF